MPRTRSLVLLILGVALAITLSFVVARVTVPTPVLPSNTSAEAGFARDMQTHHAQAVEMSIIVRDATDDPDIRLLAYDILTQQQQQAGQMAAWLNMWGLPQAAPEPSMTWMTRPTLDGATHDMHGDSSAAMEPGSPMPGYATPEQMSTLATLTGVDAEKYFLQLMIAHHQGGIEMAQAIIDRSDNTVVLDLANGIITAQEAELDYMNDLLAARQ